MKIGDRISVLRTLDCGLKRGDRGTITEIGSQGRHYVQMDVGIKTYLFKEEFGELDEQEER
jgi:hypothetical protein